jgi:hypothetical protein
MEVEKAYENLEDIITYGFLFRGICFRDSIIVLKTISDKEYKLIPFYTTEEHYTLLLYRLAFSTFMVNGYNFLKDRNKIIPKLVDMYSSIPITSLQSIITQSNTLFNEYTESLKCMEGFCYTDRSRNLWSIFSDRTAAHNGSYFGIEGLENVGLNSTQENWILINKQLDSEEAYNLQFRFSIMIASSTNPKGCKQIESQFEVHKEELEELRKDIAKYGHDKKRAAKKKEENEGWASKLNSREDMVRELNRQMTGEKDKHDVYMENWFKQQRDMVEDAKISSQEKQKAFRAKLEKDVDFSKVENSRMATPEEVDRLIKKRVIKGIEQPSDPLEVKYSKEDVIRKSSSTIIKSDN